MAAKRDAGKHWEMMMEMGRIITASGESEASQKKADSRKASETERVGKLSQEDFDAEYVETKKAVENIKSDLEAANAALRIYRERMSEHIATLAKENGIDIVFGRSGPKTRKPRTPGAAKGSAPSASPEVLKKVLAALGSAPMLTADVVRETKLDKISVGLALRTLREEGKAKGHNTDGSPAKERARAWSKA